MVAGAEKSRHPSRKAGNRSGYLPGNRRPGHWSESSCQVRIANRRISVPRRIGRKTASGIVAEPLDFTPGPEQLSSRNTGAGKTETGIAPENRNGVTIMARTKTPAPAPHAARSAADTATTPEPAPIAPAAADSPAAAVLAALSAEPAGAAVAVIAARAGISTAAARQALLAHEKGRHRDPGQGRPARHRRHLEARRPGSPGRRGRRAARRRAGRRRPARPGHA